MFKSVAFGLAAAGLVATAASAATATADLNMRSGPGVAYPVIAVIPANTPVAVSSCDQDGAWCAVNAGGTEGWASAAYLANIGNTVTVGAAGNPAPAAVAVAPAISSDAASQGHSYDVFPSQDSIHYGGKYP